MEELARALDEDEWNAEDDAEDRPAGILMDDDMVMAVTEFFEVTQSWAGKSVPTALCAVEIRKQVGRNARLNSRRKRRRHEGQGVGGEERRCGERAA